MLFFKYLGNINLGYVVNVEKLMKKAYVGYADIKDVIVVKMAINLKGCIMGLFGFGGVSHGMEENQIQKAMDSIGAYKGTHSENCESCRYWLSSSQTGSKYFGGCSAYQIKVFASYACNNFSR